MANGVGRRILEAATHGREVAELDEAAARSDRHVADVVLALELAAHAHEDAVAARVDRAAREHAVLGLQALGDLQRRDAEGGETLVRELDVHALALPAEHVHLLDHRHPEQAPLDVLGDVAEFRLADAVALDGVHQVVHVAVFVVEDRADDAFGQLELDVAELLARLIPGLALVFLRGAAANGQGHAAEALPRERHDLLVVVDLLELLLHAVQHFVLDLLRRGARPDHDRRHRRHGEVRVLELPEPREADDAGHRDHEDQEQDDGAVLERPLREIEGFHRAAWRVVVALPSAAPESATRSPGAILCTPATTTSSPAGGPETSTSSLR